MQKGKVGLVWFGCFGLVGLGMKRNLAKDISLILKVRNQSVGFANRNKSVFVFFYHLKIAET